jgi:Flp pilus assembly protein TadG
LDQRGGALIKFVLVLPLFLILVFGSFVVWKIVSAKQSLA